MRTVQMELLRPEEILAEKKRISLVNLPVGPVEWHSYHMPMGTDGLAAQETARRTAALTGGLVAPTLFIGTETHDSQSMLENLNVDADGAVSGAVWGMDFPANVLPSLYFREEVFATVVREELRLLAKMGFRMIVIVNGHGAHGQVESLRRLSAEITHELGVTCLYPEFEEQRVKALIMRERMDPGHADRLETSMMMAMTDSVALNQLPAREIPLHSADFGIASGSQFMGRAPKDGVVRDDPRDATPSLGEAFFAAGAADLAEYVLAAYRQREGDIN